MDKSMENENRRGPSLRPYLTAPGALALSVGTSIGWGSMVVTCNTYLAKAGPLGSALGLIIGCVIMLLVSRCYEYLCGCFPEAGGAYAYAREAFGYDHGFLVAWFLTLTYLAILWANATALPLFARYFLGDMFRTGRLYSVFGYDVYLGEALLSAAALALTALCLVYLRDLTSRILVMLVAVFTAAILIAFLAAIFRHGQAMSPYFAPDSGRIGQVLNIAVISPWAFIGFESISHGAEEFSFRRKSVGRILRISVAATTLLYILLMVLSVTAYPPEYASWHEYISDLGSLSGIRALPAFYAAERYLGTAGVTLLTAALLALIITSLIGNLLAVSRLFYAMARDRILPRAFSGINSHGNPGRAILLATGISCIIPFIGRTAIGWIVDVTTIGATLIYGFTAASAMRMAKTRGDERERRTGLLTLVIMIAFGVWLLVPNLFMSGSMEAESYILFVVWSVLGFVYFRIILSQDREKRFGKSIIVWIALLSLILFVSLVWMNQSFMAATGRAMENIESYYASAGFSGGDQAIIADELRIIRLTNARSIIVVVGLFALSLGVLLNNYALMSRRARESEEQLGKARDIANTDPLTGVKSKHAWMEKEAEADGMIRAGEAGAFAVVVCDVNGLKHINDTKGHKAGDRCIQEACRMICEIFKHSPVYRTGGDEFVVYLSGRDYRIREELLRELHERSVSHIGTEEAVVSGGMSGYRREDKDVHAVFERADARMYEEKQALKSLGAITRE